MTKFTQHINNCSRGRPRIDTVTVGPRYLRIPQEAYAALGAPAAATLWFDSKSRKVGVKAAPDPTVPGAYTVRAAGPSFTIGATNLSQAYNLTLGRYPWELKDDMVVIGPVPASTSKEAPE